MKRPPPKGKKVRMDHPFILGVCQNLTFYNIFTIIFQLVCQNPLFKLLSYFNSCVYLRSIYRRPHIIIIIISKWDSHFKIRTLSQMYTQMYNSAPKKGTWIEWHGYPSTNNDRTFVLTICCIGHIEPCEPGILWASTSFL